ncbi:MAG: UPF0175 family protein [Deltaproteobacteria bacterium]|nr:UPF0175 family protein [Deltaproteobacteria bacterium]
MWIFLLAVKLFELRSPSLGKAAELCGIKKLNFMDEMWHRSGRPPCLPLRVWG